MKNFFTTLILIFLLNNVYTQNVPFGFNYQGVARDASGNPYTNRKISLELSIINEIAGNIVFKEIHEDVITSDVGIFNVVIGKGTGDKLENIAWGLSRYSLRTRIDVNGGQNYKDAGKSDLVSVPYALYALNTAQEAEPGPQGPQGDPGPVGPQGPTGPTGDRGPTGLQGPIGMTGPAGIPGPAGPANNLSIGTVTSGQNAAATISGNAPQQTLSLVLPQGPKGDQGPTGPQGPVGLPGPANSLTIGNVSSGQNASASITGPTPDQKLHLVLPQGPKGDQGPTGPQGPQGEQGDSFWTIDSDTRAVYNGNGLKLVNNNNTTFLNHQALFFNSGQGFSYTKTGLGYQGTDGSILLENNLLHITGPNNYNSIFEAGGIRNFGSVQTNDFIISISSTPKLVIGSERVEVNTGIKIGNTTLSQDGMMRYTGSDFQGYTGGQWKSLTSGGSGGGITGSGASGYISRFTGAATLGNSGLFQASNGNIGIGTTSPAYLLDVRGAIRSNGLSELSSINGLGTVTTYGPNGSVNVRLSAPGINSNFGALTINDNNGNLRIINSIDSDGYGWSGTFGSNGNSNVTCTSLINFPNNGFLAVQDGNGSERAGVFVNSNSAGSIYTLGPNGSYNVFIGNNSSNFNQGFVQACNSSGSARAEMFSTNSGRGEFAIYDNSNNYKGGIYIDGNNTSVVTANLKSFHMQDPLDQSKSIWYASLEGPEAGAYERGVAHLKNGEIFIPYSDHFKKVINTNTVTIILTPQSIETYGLAVVEKKATGFVVKELMHGKGNFSFDWEVKGVRKGYEDYQVVRENDPQLLKKANQPEAVRSAEIKIE